MEENDFQKDLEIDIENLEVEACLQAELFFKWSKIARDAREAYDRAKLHLDITEASLAREIRENPKQHGIKGRLTEGSIQETIKTNKVYTAAVNNYIQARGESDILARAVAAMDQRKRMIEILVQLHTGEYFAGPDIPHTPKEFNQMIKQKKGEKTHEKMVGKTRTRKIKRKKKDE